MSSEQFKQLIEKYLSGTATKAEEGLVDDFFSALERRETREIRDAASEEMWDSIAESIDAFSNAKMAAESTKRQRDFSRTTKICVAAVIIIMLIFAGTRTYLKREIEPPSAVSWVSAKSEKGQKSLITLSDGTKIYLNAGSSISYPETFENNRREINLSGEAFFEVAEDKKRPLMVRTGNVTTEVLGTSFNVEAFSGSDIKITVVTGKVQVQANRGQLPADVDRLVLQPNEQAVYDERSVLERKAVNVESAIAWKTNTLVFDGQTIEQVAATLERWYNVTITFQNDNIKLCRINGQYRDMELQSVLKSIQYMYQIKFQYLNQNNVQLYGKGCK
jgi:ferric-dicitrate binding protein FerR (iron transport regulator)